MSEKHAHRPTICVDFDGVIADYSEGFKGRGVFGDSIPGSSVVLNTLHKEGWKIIVFSTRGEVSLLKDYLIRNGIPFDEINKNSDNPPGTNEGKPIADVYLDDRAIQFNGDWSQAYHDIINFKPWFEKEEN